MKSTPDSGCYGATTLFAVLDMNTGRVDQMMYNSPLPTGNPDSLAKTNFILNVALCLYRDCLIPFNYHTLRWQDAQQSSDQSE